jgi:acyl carrier protein
MTPNSADIREQLATLARDQLGWTKPLPEGDLAAGLDSVDRLALVVAIEDHYQIAFEPEDDEAATTLDDVVRIVALRLAAKG